MNFGPGRACVMALEPDCENGFHVDSAELLTKNSVTWSDGAGGFNKSFGFKDIIGGTSSFVILDEIRAGIHPLDPRGAWALGYAGASLTMRHGLITPREDAAGPNNQTVAADDAPAVLASEPRNEFANVAGGVGTTGSLRWLVASDVRVPTSPTHR